jgi:hypothetical protein
MMILLTVVCNVIIGLSSKPCDLIIQSVKMIIRLVMSMHLPPSANEYTAHQTHVLQQLPKSLHAALNTFKLDAKTTVYAACPACHFTHAPKLDRITGDRVYPKVCDNYVLEMDKQRLCSEPLLDDRNGKPRPIKPYLYASFTDHLARLLSNPEIESMCDRVMRLWLPSDSRPQNSFPAYSKANFSGHLKAPAHRDFSSTEATGCG